MMMMTHREAARALDADGQIVAAAWGYELALADEPDDTELRLDLAALYVAATNPGIIAAHHLPQPFVNVAYDRCLALLEDGIRRGGPHPELIAWRLHLKERVVGEEIPPGTLEALARDERAQFARLLIYVLSGRALEQASAEATFRAASARRTERERICMGDAPPERPIRPRATRSAGYIP